MKKILLFLFLSIVLVGCNFGGDITTTEPITIETENYLEITTVDELKNIEMNKSYILMNNLNLNNQEWEPLGDFHNPFLGNFDGNGMSISNLSITDDDSQFNGLFGYVEGNIFDLNIIDFNIVYNTDKLTFAGGLAGTVTGDIENVVTNGSIDVVNVKSNTFAGLLVGASQKQVDVTTDITNFKPNNIIGNEVTGTISVTGERIAFVGGLIGKVLNSIVTNNISEVNLDVITNNSVSYVGGLIGHNYGGVISGYEQERIALNIAISNNIALSIINSEAKGFNAYTGGLIGYNFFGDAYNNFTETVIVASGIITASSLLIGEDWNSNLHDMLASGTISYFNQVDIELFQAPFVSRRFGSTTTADNYYHSEQDLGELTSKINNTYILNTTWYQENLDWEQDFINSVIDRIE
jgi:hypothetical protein